jgi:trehalose 6-phosphate phosphatase
MNPHTPEGAEGLAAIRKSPGEALLAFDFDGVLAPIVPEPSAARAHPRAAAALGRLSPLVGSAVIITGRPAAVAVEYGGLEGIEGLIVLGQYGLERWESGKLIAPEPSAGVDEVRAKLSRVLEAAGAPPGVFIEDKGHALAVHTRRAAEPQVALERLRSLLIALAERHGLVVEPGRLVLELRSPGMDKGVALRAVVAERAAGSVLFAGDDLGDLPAFDTVEALRAEGIPGIKVCSGSAEVTAVAERADLIVEGPAGIVDLMGSLADSLDPAGP